ncbi:hypothetical protein N0V84_012699 [Fusarium piperis]|uniref:Uncharacterized protein n=1 Tax=Fusarium piperis TaxID=1435070 RepID=A0A9W8T9Q2_9HYPO|nr:hypothetical protein N0V84_012699 [Fusarium piperis]
MGTLVAEQPALQQNTNTLSAKVAIVTGSSRGIGAAIAIELSRRGAKVVLNYPDPTLRDEAEAVGKSIATESIAVEADLSTTDGPAKLIADAVARFGTVDILVNNAGRVLMAPLADATLEQWQQSMDTNARGVFLTTQAVLPHLTPRGAGTGARIINIISAAARDPEPHQTVYGATKAAIDSMTKCWAVELPPKYGCTVNSVAPGPILTEGSKVTMSGMEDVLKTMFDAKTPVPGAWGMPEDVSWAVAFLAEERSGWINGQSLNISGGMVRW